MHRATPANTSFRAYSAGGARSVIDQIDDSKLMQEMKGNMMIREMRAKVESPQNYGFTSHNMPADKGQDGSITGSAETFISYMGGNRSFPVAGNIDDRRHRLKDLDPGDTAMYRTKDDYQQFHMTMDGGFWSAARDKTVRLALIDQDSGSQQQQQGGQGGGNQPGQLDSSSGGSGGGGQGGGQQQGQNKPTGQKSVKSQNQQSKRFMHITKDEAASSGTNVRQYLDDGVGYHEVNTDKNVYTGALKGKGKFAKVVTTAGPTKNVFGFLG
jgi:phage gp45-like